MFIRRKNAWNGCEMKKGEKRSYNACKATVSSLLDICDILAALAVVAASASLPDCNYLAKTNLHFQNSEGLF